MWKSDAYLRQLSAMAMTPLSLTLVQLQSSEVMLRHLAAAWRSILSPVNWPRLQPEIFSSWRNEEIDVSMLHAYMQEVTMACDSTHLPLVPQICQWTRSELVKVMACRLFGAKPLPEPMLVYCQLDKFQWNLNQNSIIFIKKMHLKLSLPKWWPFCPEEMS